MRQCHAKIGHATRAPYGRDYGEQKKTTIRFYSRGNERKKERSGVLSDVWKHTETEKQIENNSGIVVFGIYSDWKRLRLEKIKLGRD